MNKRILFGACIFALILVMPCVSAYVEGQPFPDWNMSNPVQTISYANEVTDNWATIMALFLFAGVIFILSIRQGNNLSSSLSYGCFVSFVLGGLLFAMGYIEAKYLIVTLVLAILTFLLSMFDSS